MSNGNSAGDDFRMRYQCFIDDLKYIKSRQWVVTYYLLLLLAAIIGFFSTLDTNYPTAFPPDTLKCILLWAAFGVGLIGSYFQYDFQRRLQDYRVRNVTEVVPHMSKAFQEYENIASLQGRRCYLSFFNGIQFPLIFILILWAGVSIVYLKLFGYDIKWMGGILLGGLISFFAVWFIFWFIARLCKGGD